MSTIVSKQPTPVASRNGGTKNFNLRAYFAGGAATILLIAAGFIVFGSLAAYVAFNGLPIGGANGGSDSVALQASGPAGTAGTAGAPRAAAAALAAAPGAVAAAPAAPTAIAPAPGTPGASNGSATTPGAPGATTTGTSPTSGTSPTGTAPTGTSPTGTAPTGDTSSSSPGAVGNTVQNVQDAAAGAGVDLPLTDATQGLTGTVDNTVQGTLNQVGSTVGNPNLGTQVNDTVNNVTDGLLGN